MPRLRFEKRAAPLWTRSLLPLMAVGVTFVLTSLLIFWANSWLTAVPLMISLGLATGDPPSQGHHAQP